MQKHNVSESAAAFEKLSFQPLEAEFSDTEKHGEIHVACTKRVAQPPVSSEPTNCKASANDQEPLNLLRMPNTSWEQRSSSF